MFAPMMISAFVRVFQSHGLAIGLRVVDLALEIVDVNIDYLLNNSDGATHFSFS